MKTYTFYLLLFFSLFCLSPQTSFAQEKKASNTIYHFSTSVDIGKMVRGLNNNGFDITMQLQYRLMRSAGLYGQLGFSIASHKQPLLYRNFTQVEFSGLDINPGLVCYFPLKKKKRGDKKGSQFFWGISYHISRSKLAGEFNLLFEDNRMEIVQVEKELPYNVLDLEWGFDIKVFKNCYLSTSIHNLIIGNRTTPIELDPYNRLDYSYVTGVGTFNSVHSDFKRAINVSITFKL